MRKILRKLLQPIGYDLIRYNPKEQADHACANSGENICNIGDNPFSDISYYLTGTEEPTFLDVGANEGQTIRNFLQVMPRAKIYAFEPGLVAFEQLSSAVVDFGANVHLLNNAVGAKVEKKRFIENDLTVMSSFLEPDKACWGRVVNERDVLVTTIDQIVEDYNIGSVDVLKSDTQGYDLEVFKGAKNSFEKSLIKMVYLELIFSEMYQNQPSYLELLQFLENYNFRLVAIYDSHYREDLIGWCDVLFVHRSQLN